MDRMVFFFLLNVSRIPFFERIEDKLKENLGFFNECLGINIKNN